MGETEAKGEVWGVSFLHLLVCMVPRAAHVESHSFGPDMVACGTAAGRWSGTITGTARRCSAELTVALPAQQGSTPVAHTVLIHLPITGSQEQAGKRPDSLHRATFSAGSLDLCQHE